MGENAYICFVFFKQLACFYLFIYLDIISFQCTLRNCQIDSVIKIVHTSWK